MNCEYCFKRGVINQLLEESGNMSCVTDRNKTQYHNGLVSSTSAFPDPNIASALFGMVGEYAYHKYFGLEWNPSEYNPHGDGGVDLVLDGFTVDVKTRSRPVKGAEDPVGYIRSVMGDGTVLKLIPDFYFFAAIGEGANMDMIKVSLHGGISKLQVALLPDIESPISGCYHKNKVVTMRNITTTSIEDLWN